MSGDSTAVAVAAPAAPAVDTKRPQADTLLADVFRLMDYPAKLEFKDMTDGSLGVACHFEGELPGVTVGKRSSVVDSVQFWLNKVVNRPNTSRRWVNLGVNAFPEPRQQGQQPREVKEVAAVPAPSAPAKAVAKPAAAAATAKAPAPAPAKDQPKRRDEKPAAPQQQSRGGSKVDERTLTPAADPALTGVAKALAEKSAKLGRVYAVMGLTNDQRALMLKAAEGLKGVTAKAEGEGHWRRLVMVPEKLTPIARKQVMPDYDDEGDEDE